MNLLYDSGLPGLRAGDGTTCASATAPARLGFVDIAAPGFDAAAWGTTHAAALDAELHAVCADGRAAHRHGGAARGLCRGGPGLGAGTQRLGPAGPPVADVGYRLFARHRRGISRAAAPLIGALRSWRAHGTHARMARCQAGACRLHEVGHEDGA